MADENKTYSPETIEGGSTVSGKSYSPDEIPDTPFPQTVVASEVQGVVRSATGNKVIDELGLVSSENFQFGTVVLSSQITRTASGWGDATGLSLTFTLPREAYIFIIASLSGKNTSLTTSGGEQLIRFDINGTPTSVWNLHGVPGGAGLEAVSATIHHIVLLSAGSNTIKVQHRWAVLGDAILLGSTGTEYAGCRLSYLVLGK